MGGETEADVSGWTVDTAMTHLQRQILDLRRQLDERYETQTKAVDAAFLAQQTAMQTAFTASDKAVQAALASAKEAVIKAENYANERFAATNEFRGQLSDQASTFLSRQEAEAYRMAAEAKIATLVADLDKLEKRMDLNQGQASGVLTAIEHRRAQSTQVVAIVGAVLIAISIAVAVILGFNG